MTQAERKAKERQARASEGLQRVEVWAHKDDAPQIRELANRLRSEREKSVDG